MSRSTTSRGYRGLYLLNWIYRYFTEPLYRQWIGAQPIHQHTKTVVSSRCPPPFPLSLLGPIPVASCDSRPLLTLPPSYHQLYAYIPPNINVTYPMNVGTGRRCVTTKLPSLSTRENPSRLGPPWQTCPGVYSLPACDWLPQSIDRCATRARCVLLCSLPTTCAMYEVGDLLRDGSCFLGWVNSGRAAVVGAGESHNPPSSAAAAAAARAPYSAFKQP